MRFTASTILLAGIVSTTFGTAIAEPEPAGPSVNGHEIVPDCDVHVSILPLYSWGYCCWTPDDCWLWFGEPNSVNPIPPCPTAVGPDSIVCAPGTAGDGRDECEVVIDPQEAYGWVACTRGGQCFGIIWFGDERPSCYNVPPP